MSHQVPTKIKFLLITVKEDDHLQIGRNCFVLLFIICNGARTVMYLFFRGNTMITR